MVLRKNAVRGQGMTEYIVILALVVVSAIGVYSFFGKTVRAQMAGVAQEISGRSAEGQVQEAQRASQDASQRANRNYGLQNYDDATNSGG
ncbi:MAG: pilus assembly protein [Idiomarina sp.]|nr:pilus assembly protein [Idiomarina sp.]